MSTVDRVHDAVLTAMLRAEFAPGTWLRQDDLAHQLGVSKIPVREALHRLAARGLVRFEANRGVVVPELSAADAEENFVLRQAIEPQLLARALPLLSIVDLAEAELSLTSQALTPTQANWAFHRALYSASGWRHGLAMCEILHAAVAPYVGLYTDELGGRDDSDAQHLALLAACRSGDKSNAVAVLTQHLSEASDALTTYLVALKDSA